MKLVSNKHKNTMNSFEMKIIFWLKLIAFLLWCFLTAFIFYSSGDDVGGGWIITSLVIVVLHFALTALTNKLNNHSK